MKIVFGSDHVGLPLKKTLMELAQAMGHQVSDIGAHSTERTDYPQYGREAAQQVATGEADRAVVICGTGVGISLAANSVRGVRCVVCSEPYSAQLSRLHNNTNALALGARVVGDSLAEMIMRIWLETGFEGGRHQARVDTVNEMKAAG